MKQEPLDIYSVSESEESDADSKHPRMLQYALPEPPPKRIRLMSIDRCQQPASQVASSSTGSRKLPGHLLPHPPIRSRPMTDVEKKCLEYLKDLTDQMQAASLSSAMQEPVPRPSEHLMRKLAKVITLSGHEWVDILQSPAEHCVWTGQPEEHMWRFR